MDVQIIHGGTKIVTTYLVVVDGNVVEQAPRETTLAAQTHEEFHAALLLLMEEKRKLRMAAELKQRLATLADGSRSE